MSEWISVEDRLPSRHKSVIAWVNRYYYPDHFTMASIQNEDGVGDSKWSYPEQTGFGRITHWMPLPESPNA